MYRAIRDLRIAMSNKAIKRKAEEHLGNGLPKQHAFDLLLAEYPEAKPKKVAEVLRYMPSQMARERYRALHQALLAVIVASAALRILRSVLNETVKLDQATAYLGLVPVATLLVGWSLYRWQGQVFTWVAWGNLAGAFGLWKALKALPNGGGDPWNLVLSVLSVGIGALALYLAHKVFTKPKVEKDPLGLGTVWYVFPEDPRI